MNDYIIFIIIAFVLLAAGLCFIAARLFRVSDELRKSREEMKSVTALMQAQNELRTER